MVDSLTSALQDLMWINLCMLVEVHWSLGGMGSTMHNFIKWPIIFLEFAGKLHIIALRRTQRVQHIHSTLTPLEILFHDSVPCWLAVNYLCKFRSRGIIFCLTKTYVIVYLICAETHGQLAIKILCKFQKTATICINLTIKQLWLLGPLSQ